MEKSMWASDDPIQPVQAARQAAANSSRSSPSARPDPNLFQPPQSQPIRMASPDGPKLFNPTQAAQVSAENSNFTRGITKPRSREARPRATGGQPDRSSPAFSRADSAMGIRTAPFSNTTNTHGSRQSAFPPPSQAKANPTINIDKQPPSSTSTAISSTATASKPTRSFIPPHDRKTENDRPTSRDISPNGEHWRSQKDNKFSPFLNQIEKERSGAPRTAEQERIQHASTRNDIGRYDDDHHEYKDLDAAYNHQASLSYDDYAEPEATAAPVHGTAPPSNNAIEDAKANLIKESQRLEKEEAVKKQKEQEKVDAQLAREIQEREAKEDAARVAEEQEAERAAERIRQRHEAEAQTQNPTPTATTAPQPQSQSVPQQTDYVAQLAALHIELIKENEEYHKFEDIKNRAKVQMAIKRDKIHDIVQQIRAVEQAGQHAT